MEMNKERSFGLRIKQKKRARIAIQKHVASTVRRINMDYHPKGFAGNAGWSDTFLTNRFGFSWYFESERSRDEAYNLFIELLNESLTNKMDITFLNNIENRTKTFYKRVKRLA